MRALRSLRARVAALAAFAALAAPGAALAQSTFTARADRLQVGAGDSLVYEVTLSLESGRADGYRPPDFRAFRVIGEYPSQSTRISMGGGGSFMRTVYSWRYELQPLEQGRFTIGPARVRAEGRELRTEAVTVTVVAGATPGRPPAPPPRRRPFPGFGPGASIDDLFGDDPGAAQPAAEGSFVRVVADKTKVFVGEAVNVEWYLYLTERPDKVETVAQPRTDGFWSEDLAQANAAGTLSHSQQSYQGRVYLVAPFMRKALFPLKAGKLTITPLESELSQIDFFGRALRSQRIKAEPLEIEAVPLPAAGRPAGFDAASVGRFSLEARVDRDKVAVGEAITLTVAVRGEGNVRKLVLPAVPPLEGWKAYEPKIEVKIDNQNGIAGTKTAEYLLLPERPGTTIVPALELPFFDPAERRYVTERSAPLRVEVTPDGRAGSKPGVSGAAGAVAGLENVLPTEIRPPRARPTLRRDLGTTFYRSRAFAFALALPPLAFGLHVAAARLRERLSQETERGRRRRMRRLVKKRLRAAEAHLEGGQTSPFYIEIDRVLREVLTARVGRPVTGLSREELEALIAQSGVGPELALRLIAMLEECDRARFAPGGVGGGEMRAALERVAELILAVEKAPLRPAAREARA